MQVYTHIVNNQKWDLRMLELAKHVSNWSKDPSTKVGAVIADGKYIVSLGYNGLPEGIGNEEKILNDRELKYETIIHGEINAIATASRSVRGCTLYTYPFLPCSRCASQIIQHGINRVVSYVNYEDRWRKSIMLSEELFSECNIEVVQYES